MVSFRILVLEETPQYETDVDGRGAPIPQLTKRQLRFELAGAKTLHTATPGTEGHCPVTADFFAGDQRRLYHPCPACGHYLRWDWERFEGFDTGRPFVCCPACQGRTEHRHKAEGVRRAQWLPTFPSRDPQNPAPDWHVPAAEVPTWQARPTEGRQPSYHLWQAVSSAVDWAWIAREWQAVQKGTDADRVTFEQQVLGRATKVRVDAANLDTLAACLEPQARGVVPEGAYLLTGSVDLNGDFAAWAVWAWGPGLEAWLVDTGTVEGSPSDPVLWRELARLVARRFPHAEGGECPVQAWGVDSGYGTASVYAFCSSYSHVKALDGRDGWGLAPLRRAPKPSRVQGPDGTVAAARVWSVGTWDLKRSLYEGLGVTQAVGPLGRAALKLHLPDWTSPVGPDGTPSKTWLEQLTAETLVERVDPKTGVVREAKWVRHRRRNEALDLWVYCAALAKALGVGVPGSEPDWLELRRRVVAAAQHDLADLWSRAPTGGSEAGEPPPAAAPNLAAGGEPDLAALYAAANAPD
jgi:phage terminase large subunit GpA-like protein